MSDKIMKKIIDIKIDIKIDEDFCMESEPCQHNVDIIYEDGKIISDCMYADDIELLLISLKKTVSKHFKDASKNVEVEFGLFD